MQMIECDLLERMRRDWNQRACEDAYYYAGFGRRKQETSQFLSSGEDVVRLLEGELSWLSPGAQERALEIGCGPGRLMRALARHFDEIHGVDVSDRMVALAQQNLEDVPNARVTRTNGTDLDVFPDDSFDFVYSFAVFQHIPSSDVVFRYLEEACRVLKPGGVFRGQFNGLAQSKHKLTTWSGACIPAEPIARFAREHRLRLLAVEGPDTRYMWVTWCKTGAEDRSLTPHGSIVRWESPIAARFSLFLVQVRDFPPGAGLNDLTARLRGSVCRICCIRPPDSEGVTELRLLAPPLAPGSAALELSCRSTALWSSEEISIVDGGPLRPHIWSAVDGVSALLGNRILSRVVKVVIEGLQNPAAFRAAVDDVAAPHSEPFCVDPWRSIYEINVRLPRGIGPGCRQLAIRVGGVRLPDVLLRVGVDETARLFPRLPAAAATLELDGPCRVRFAGEEDRAHDVVADAGRLPFRTATFHAAACDARASAEELGRVVRPDGMVYAVLAQSGSIAHFARALGKRHTGSRRLGRRVGAYFTGGIEPPQPEPWTNACRRCRQRYSAALLESCGVVARWSVFSTFACPDCGARNVYQS
jgi:SAM-dependent methyltransferase